MYTKIFLLPPLFFLFCITPDLLFLPVAEQNLSPLKWIVDETEAMVNTITRKVRALQ